MEGEGSAEGAELLQQRLGSLLQELRLPLIADLDHGDVGEPGRHVRLDGLRDRVQIRAARDGVGDVRGPDELARAREAGWRRQVGVDRPAAGEQRN